MDVGVCLVFGVDLLLPGGGLGVGGGCGLAFALPSLTGSGCAILAVSGYGSGLPHQSDLNL